jgi:adenosylmethionine-8-amino-7-oxononanoate aminotransferase
MSRQIPIHDFVIHRSSGDMPLIERGEGVYLFDREGKRYLDGASGSAAVVNLGHGVDSILEAMHEQGRKVSYFATHVFTNEAVLSLGEAVARRAPFRLQGECRSWFSCSGTDAVDDSIRLARQFHLANGDGTRHIVIARWGSFHGNSISVAGVHGHTLRRRAFSPMYLPSPHIPPAYCYRCEYGLIYPGCELRCAEALEVEILRLGVENVAAFIAEPVVGATLGGVPAAEGYFERIAEICTRQGVLFIADEVMTGWGRLGEWFGMETYAASPDIAAIGKGFGAGYSPIAGTIAANSIWDAILREGGQFLAGHTMNQNPIGCAAALAVIEFMEEHDVLDHVRETGAYLSRRLNDLREYAIIGDCRGRGMMHGIEFVQDKATRTPFDPGLKVSLRYQSECLKRGLIQYAAQGCVNGVAGDMALVTPPLVITGGEIDEMVDIMEQSIKACQDELGYG